eukprot:CAMPEP_0201147848 /NCGR_PEP_ID=MMETSP0851-20130426/9357_1 /ASSEMBLY_ACC=CAM_ASM_000631 /TAXON_ID=183588 /ORGANISM="Pseudo-nitzschia fraudulenta, Strain WWA7" /LENGTH=88 /DNA_ID=CAMNT_0047423817 /DNA_START=1988 /DNA_END=2254 /DNA_ORIENTATION=-
MSSIRPVEVERSMNHGVLFIVSPENSKTIVGLKASGISIGDVRLSICDAGVVIVFAPAIVSLLCNKRRLIKLLSPIADADAAAVCPAD